MKTKQEQIEEMTKERNEIKDIMKLLDKCVSLNPMYKSEVASVLYGNNYRKLPEDSVVLSREEYEMLKRLYDTQKGAIMTSSVGDLPLQEQIAEMAKIVDEMYNVYTTTAEDIAEGLYNAGYRKAEEVRKETAKEIFQKVVNICRKEEDFQDGTVNTQLEPLYFGIMNGCAFIRGEVKELAEQYGVEVEE